MKSRFLNNCDIWVTLEPCIMCSGFIKQTRVKRLYFGAEDKKGGAVDNGYRVFSGRKNNKSIEIYSGISDLKCKSLMKNFFKKLR